MKIAFLATTRQRIVHVISAKFCTRKQNGMPSKAMWQKLQILKSNMANRRHFENR